MPVCTAPPAQRSHLPCSLPHIKKVRRPTHRRPAPRQNPGFATSFPPGVGWFQPRISPHGARQSPRGSGQCLTEGIATLYEVQSYTPRIPRNDVDVVQFSCYGQVSQTGYSMASHTHMPSHSTRCGGRSRAISTRHMALHIDTIRSAAAHGAANGTSDNPCMDWPILLLALTRSGDLTPAEHWQRSPGRSARMPRMGERDPALLPVPTCPRARLRRHQRPPPPTSRRLVR